MQPMPGRKGEYPSALTAPCPVKDYSEYGMGRIE